MPIPSEVRRFTGRGPHLDLRMTGNEAVMVAMPSDHLPFVGLLANSPSAKGSLCSAWTRKGPYYVTLYPISHVLSVITTKKEHNGQIVS